MPRGALIREFRREDAAAAAAIVSNAAPFFLTTAELLVHEVRNTPPRAQLRNLVAEQAGAVSGFADARFDWGAADPGVAEVWVCVAPEARGRGLGTALYDHAAAHVVGHGAHTLTTWLAAADAQSLGFATRRGFAETRREQLWQLHTAEADLSGLPSLRDEKEREGFRLAPLSELLDRSRDLHALYEAAERDIPMENPRGDLPFGEWERETLGNPLLDSDGSWNVLHGDRVVSFAWVLADRRTGRAEHELTATHRDYRGRGLARLAKLAALRWAADSGIRLLLTGNDAENAPMLAINRRLGYRPGPVWLELERRLVEATPTA